MGFSYGVDPGERRLFAGAIDRSEIAQALIGYDKP